MNNSFFLFVALLISFFSSCSSSKQEFKVAASAVPHAQILEFIQPDLNAQGIPLKIVITNDYNMPNRALADHEVDANFFQHIPFMEEQIKQFHYPIESIAKIELEPMGIYSKKINSLAELQNGAKIALPNDPTNEGRALLLLQEQKLIQLDEPNNLQATVLNIQTNPKELQFIEIDAA
ncbi:MAG: ABC transporter substrate-binding protein, partial [Chlamydiales bacterium]|nr:ABC transporter substrate-binding protein [Chlamydiales bacterium]